MRDVGKEEAILKLIDENKRLKKALTDLLGCYTKTELEDFKEFILDNAEESDPEINPALEAINLLLSVL